ncbi:AAA family ATPase [Pseudomonas sp. NPDC007930]|uniref:AAA family ATPase n=1 Tax=Pseudomonas sp. NPDC007930 TaxID=3364417 RepID=UPI0036EA6DDF
MYLRKLQLTDFRAYEALTWELAAGEEAGWHVLIGPNGSGKSGFLRAAAIALTGPTEFAAARRPNHEFIRKGTERAQIKAWIRPDEHYDYSHRYGGMPSQSDVLGELTLELNGVIKSPQADSGAFPPWAENHGWFSAAFGPLRRFSGGAPENARLFEDWPRLAQHLSLFDEGVALTEAIEWLQKLRFQELEQPPASAAAGLLSHIMRFINQPGFLPHGMVVKSISSKGVNFEDGNGVTVPIEALSDGYRAVLSMTFELLRLMAQRFDEQQLFSNGSLSVPIPGVVLIDEVDTHLHPSWQRDIGPWLTRLFPAIQFIVTTHSPYVCQSATKGTIWALPAPGSAAQVQRIEGEQRARVLFGDVLHVLNSEAFGGLPGRSAEAGEKLDRLAQLNRANALGTLSPIQREERDTLAQQLAPVMEAFGDSPLG